MQGEGRRAVPVTSHDFPAPDLDGKSILVTGATGSFGHRFVETFLARYKPGRLVIFSRDEMKQFEMQQRLSEADYPALSAICERQGLFLLADAAQSFGASLAGKRVGSLAPVTATGFFPAKPFGCYGDGGALLTDDRERVDVMRSIRVHGRGAEKYEIVRPGVNGRLDTLQAAILLAKLPFLSGELEMREKLAQYYDARLGGLVTIPKRIDGARSAWAQYPILLDQRDRVAAELNAQGIPTAVYYPRPLHLQPAFARFGAGAGSLPVSEGLCRRVLSLPMHPYLDEAAVERVCAAVKEAAT